MEKSTGPRHKRCCLSRRQHTFIQFFILIENFILIEEPHHTPSACAAHLSRPLGIAQNLDNRIGQRLRTAQRNQPAADAVLDHFGNPADLRRDHRYFAREGLRDREAERFALRRRKQKIRPAGTGVSVAGMS